jgi:hypothetical protein
MYYAAGILSLLGLGGAAWFSVLLARADREFRKGTPAGVARAVELTPRNTAYLSRRALQIEYEGGDARPMFERMAGLNPTASAPRIRRGLDAEIRGDVETAQRWLLDAARVDRQFEPAWTLANFYFRQQRVPEFWAWMRTALEVSYGDRRPAFELCWNVTSDGQAVLSRAIPDRREVVSAYVSYLLQEHRLSDAAPVAVRLAVWHDAGDLPLLYAVCDALLDAGEGAAAMEVWTAMGHPAPQGIVNPEIDSPTGHGFDWRMVPSFGVTHGAHRIAFSGQQPESCELLRQFLRVRAGRTYVLRWEARTSGFPLRAGLEWRVADQRAPVASREDWMQDEFKFTAPTDWTLLALRYQRPSGEPRAVGYVEVRHVALTELAADERR